MYDDKKSEIYIDDNNINKSEINSNGKIFAHDKILLEQIEMQKIHVKMMEIFGK